MFSKKLCFKKKGVENSGGSNEELGDGEELRFLISGDRRGEEGDFSWALDFTFFVSLSFGVSCNFASCGSMLSVSLDMSTSEVLVGESLNCKFSLQIPSDPKYL